MIDLDLRLEDYQGHVNHCATFDVESVRDRGLVPKDHQ